MSHEFTNVRFNIPEHCQVRWQAALAVLEDLLEDETALFSMNLWADWRTQWERTKSCGTSACFAGYISVAPYCQELGYPKNNNGSQAPNWLLGVSKAEDEDSELGQQKYNVLFSAFVGDVCRREDTLNTLVKRIKRIYLNSTGNELIAPLVFEIPEEPVPSTLESR